MRAGQAVSFATDQTCLASGTYLRWQRECSEAIVVNPNHEVP